MNRSFPALAVLCAVIAMVAEALAAEQSPPAKQRYDVENAADVERSIAETFGPRRPPMDLRPLTTAWQGIVADSARQPIKIIFDTDIGTDIDDAIALAFALRRRELQVCAITTSRGQVQQRAAIVSRLLHVVQREDVPFAPGSPVLADGRTIRDKPVNQFPFAGDAVDRPKAACAEAQELFRQIIGANRGEVWLVITGPMTNAAILIRDHADVAAGLKGIVCMGGEPQRGHRETNIINDPVAAAIVCRSGMLRFVGTEDVTIRMLMPKPDIDRLRGIETPAARAVVELYGLWRTVQTSKPGPVLFDLCPLVWLFAPELFTTTSRGVAVDKGGMMSFADSAPPCAVTTDVNAVAVHRLLMDTLASR